MTEVNLGKKGRERKKKVNYTTTPWVFFIRTADSKWCDIFLFSLSVADSRWYAADKETAANAGWRRTKITAYDVKACQPALCCLSEVINHLSVTRPFRRQRCLNGPAHPHRYFLSFSRFNVFSGPAFILLIQSICTCQDRTVRRPLWFLTEHNLMTSASFQSGAGPEYNM